MKVKEIILIAYAASFSKMLCFSTPQQYQNQVLQFLYNFIPRLDNNAQVVLLLCYKREILFNIVKNAPFFITFGNLNEIDILSDSARNRLVFVTDLNCPNMTNILEKRINPAYYAHPFRWIIFTDEIRPIPSIPALPDSNIFLVIPKGNNFKIGQFYKIEQHSSTIIERYGSWSPTSGLTTYQIEKIISKRRQNLQEKVLTASVIISNNDTLNHLDDYIDKHIDSLTKINFIITKILISAINGTINHIPTDTWGFENNETGMWNGMVGDIIRKTADVTGTGIFITAPRIGKIDYLSLTSPTKIEFMFRQPPLSYVANIYSLPFAPSVWIWGVALLSLALTVILWTINVQRKLTFLGVEESQECRLSEFLLYGVSGVCQMGIPIQAKILSVRISMMFFLIAAFFFYTSYTANIVSLLQSTTKSIQSLSDLLNSQLELGVQDTPYNHYYFPAAADPIRKAIYYKSVLSSSRAPKYMSAIEGVQKMRNGLFAFHVELGLGYKIIEETFYEHEKCNLMSIPYIQGANIWIAVQKNIPYKKILKVNLFRIREYGLQARENICILSKKPVCSAGQKSFESVRLSDCCVILVILGVGYASAIFIFFIEHLLKRRRLDAYCLKI